MKVALVTCRGARGLDEDEVPLQAALERAGCVAQPVEWDDRDIDWATFDVTVLRSAWDYAERVAEFLEWVHRISALTLLLNPEHVVRWSTDKHYLAEMASKGIATVPTTIVEPGDQAAAVIAHFVERCDHPELVIKPAVGAGARDAQRHRRSDTRPAVEHIERLLAANRSVLVQPYLRRVESEGETALMFFEGRLSHAIRKGALLAASGAATPGLFAPETINPRQPGDDELSLAQRVIAAFPFAPPLYARIDLIRDERGAPCVLELELAEPSLFFVHAPGSADRFAAALIQHYERARLRQ